MRLRYLPLWIFLLLSLAAVSADPLKVDISGDFQTEPGGVVQLNIGIQNLDMINHTVFVSSDPYVILSSSKFEQFNVKPTRLYLSPQSRKELLVTLKLKKNVFIGDDYYTYLQLKLAEDESYSRTLPLAVHIIKPDKVVSLSVSVPDKVMPGDNFTVDALLINKISNLLPNVRLELESDLVDDMDRKFKLYALQDRTERFIFHVPSNIHSGDYTLTFNLYSNDELITSSSSQIKVLENVDVKEKSESDKGMFKETYHLVKINRGNSKVFEEFVLPLSRFKRYFADYNIPPTKVDKTSLHWEFYLEPDEIKEVKVVVNFVWLYIALLVILAVSIVAFVVVNRKVKIRKEILKLSELKDGTVKLKILIHVKNKSSKNIRHVNIVDFLPVVMHPKISYGLLKPSKVHKSRQGIRLYWDVPELVKGEERIISYQVQTKLSIIGRLMLPAALVRFKTKKGRLRQYRSKSLSLNIGL